MQTAYDYAKIIFRSLFSLVSLVLGSVIGLLVYFDETRDALFLASILGINIVVAIVQEIRAKRALEKLKALLIRTAKVEHNNEVHDVPLDRIQVGDILHLGRGDQVPADGHLLSAEALEVNEAFLTGESASIPKAINSNVYAGSFVVAGQARLKVVTRGDETRIAEMTSSVKRLRTRTTPIQRSLSIGITILSYVLLVAVGALVVRQQSVGIDPVITVRLVATLAAMIIPEGLVLACTLLFAYGAIRLLKAQVLLQHINAIESLARLQILCLDKTGTLTENRLQLKQVLPAPRQRGSSLRQHLRSYLALTDPEGELASALQTKQHPLPTVKGQVLQAFSSERRYGSAKIDGQVITVGAPEVLLRKLAGSSRHWLTKHNQDAAAQGQRVLAVATGSKDKKLVGLVIFAQPIKQSARAALAYFMKRGVAIKVLSGDQPATVRAIAQDLKLIKADARVVLGKDIQAASSTKLKQLVREETVFARVSPQQKARVIAVAKQLGYTGMVGDGANDALALKEAQLGISMFHAADITRTVADIVLIKDEFSDLPQGVKLADTILTNLELISCLFVQKVIIGLTLLTLTFLTGNDFPFSPRNITFLNYFIIGLPILIWTAYPRHRARSPYEAGYFAQLWPYILRSGSVAMLTTVAAYFLSLQLGASLQMTLFWTSLGLGVSLLVLLPGLYRTTKDRRYDRAMPLIFLVVGCLSLAAMVWPVSRHFFDLRPVQGSWLILGTGLVGIAVGVQLLLQKFRRTPN